MSYSVEITENKMDFWGYQTAEKRKMKSCGLCVRKTEKRGRLRRR